ncbi:hypothetical protein DL96DRAFT_1715793 [Flagelloscypha sp. PMI_526]|nr:hypothetical protein DL96DRAFT_1715793 [Flagelloscypha sp. PMI_526]
MADPFLSNVQPQSGNTNFTLADLTIALQHVQTSCDNITTALEMTRTTLETGIDNLTTRIDAQDVQIQSLSARIDNERVARLNAFTGLNRLRSTYPYKTVEGDGTTLANTLNFPTSAPIWTYPAEGQPIGTRPDFLTEDPLFFLVTPNELRALVVFYNEDFGILATDSEQQKLNKFRRFLCGN